MATYTAGEQINRALRLLGVLAEGETPSASVSQDCLMALNQMIESWNTERLSVATCVEQIKQLLQRPEFAETAASRSLLQGLALSARVRAALNGHEDTRAVDIAIEAQDGRVTLRGIVTNDAEKSAALKVAEGVAGVSALDNQLHAMSDARHFPTARR